MNAPPRLSVVLPARDAAGTLDRAASSILGGTFGDLELILVDDGSSDGSAGVMAGLARRDRRVVVVSSGPAAAGVVAATAAGVARARGEFIARMDADDVSHPGRLAAQVGLLDARPELAACGCLVRIVPAGAGGPPVGAGMRRYQSWVNALVEPEDIARERFVESPVVNPTALFRRSVYRALGGYRDCAWPEDYDLWLRMVEAGHPVAKAPQVLFDWCDSPGRLTRTDERYSHLGFLRAKAHYIARLPAVRAAGVAVAGAGPTGKRLAALLRAEGVRVRAFEDVNPRRVGTQIAGVPVLPADGLGPARSGAPVFLAAAGRPGQRERVRALLRGRGFVEGEGFFCAA